MSTDTDLIIIGGGPAGCATALMAASLGMRSTLIEPHALCHTLQPITALNNVLGGFTTGPDLAAAITDDITRTPLCHLRIGERVTHLAAHDDHVAATLNAGQRLTAPHAAVATGTTPLLPQRTDWITAPDDLPIPSLRRADPAELKGTTCLVLGADRPLGTLLRTHPTADFHLIVAYPPSDTYKTDEVRPDPRVDLLPTRHLTLKPGATHPLTAELITDNGTLILNDLDAVHHNLGNAPTHPNGTLTPDPTGYCPPHLQHPRIHTAGDLRSPRAQRIMTAIGSGSEAALNAYYHARRLA